jgi:hypothetical protein
MLPDEKLNKFVQLLRNGAAANLESVILYGSAASGEFQAKFSNLNVFCTLRDSSFGALLALEPAVKWWRGKNEPAPLLMTREELQHSTDVFAIELMDMRQHHRVIFGEDVLQGLEIPTHFHRIQVEYELREKLVVLRQAVCLSSASDRKLWDLLLQSLPSFLTLFRHALIALGEPAPDQKRECIRALSERLRFDPSVINEALDVREHKTKPKQLDVKRIFAGYLATIEQVNAAVDKMLDAEAPQRA